MAEPLRLVDMQLEQLQLDYTALLQENIDEARDLVAAYWDDKGDPIDLPAVLEENWLPGGVPDNGDLFSIVEDFPTVTIEAERLEPTGDGKTMGQVTLRVRVYTLADTLEEARKVAYRYQAVVATILWQRKPKGVKLAYNMVLDVSPILTDSRGSFLRGSEVSQTLLVQALL